MTTDASVQLNIGEEKSVAGHLVKVTKGRGKRRVKVSIKPDPSCKSQTTRAQSAPSPVTDSHPGGIDDSRQ